MKVDLLPKLDQGLTPDVVRKETGLWSIDEACRWRDRGIPMRTPVEMYGREGVGKSTVALFLAGIANPEGKIALVDTEGALDPEYIPMAVGRSGFKGEIKIIDFADMKKDKKILKYHGTMAQEAMAGLVDEYDAIILDSIGGWVPEAEKEGDIGDANMGRRARDITQFARGVANNLKIAEDPKIAIFTNHVLQNLSARGTYTPGGRGKQHLAGVRFLMWRNETFDDGTFQTKVKVEKLRWGGTHKDAIGQVVIIPGHGIATGLTAVFDCINLGLAKREAVVRYKAMKAGEEQWNSAGRIGTLIENEKEGDMTKFNPFFKLLKEYTDERENA